MILGWFRVYLGWCSFGFQGFTVCEGLTSRLWTLQITENMFETWFKRWFWHRLRQAQECNAWIQETLRLQLLQHRATCRAGTTHPQLPFVFTKERTTKWPKRGGFLWNWLELGKMVKICENTWSCACSSFKSKSFSWSEIAQPLEFWILAVWIDLNRPFICWEGYQKL